MNRGSDLPQWVDAVLESLEVETDSAGGLHWAFIPEEGQLTLAPAVAELQGGAQDGAEVYSFYRVELNSFFMLFDEMPTVSFSTRDGECSVEGMIEDTHAWIVCQTHPFEDESPSFTVKDGKWSQNDD